MVGKNTECENHICCRDVTGDPDPNDPDPTHAAGPYGHPNCGLPYTAMEEMFKHAASEHSVGHLPHI